MQLKWGSYSFDENACSVRSNTRILTAPETGRPLRYATRASVEGWLEGDSQSALATAEDALRTALLKPYQDLKFLTDGGVVTPLSLLNSDSITGVRVLDFAFPSGDGAEYATLRRFTAEVEAEFVIPGAQNAIVSFSEQLAWTGSGGPDVVIRVPINSPVMVEQVVTPATPCYVIQSGQAVGHTVRPNPNRPLWPLNEIGKQRNLVEGSPRRIGRGLVDFPVSWSYYFQFARPPVGHPAVPPL
jgi:hypothetical protein